ncbi:hypothetical protein [Streptomyces sp. H27-G5]|uniref:hypothetical protein n=1 Tax=Streptomyces sp. H27-G5 TaxID=2996698 RepID=UPI003B633E67
MTGRRACPPEDCGGPWGYATSSKRSPIPSTKNSSNGSTVPSTPTTSTSRTSTSS